MENLTIEQAFNNIALGLEHFKGTRQEHIVLEHSMIKIKDLIVPKEVEVKQTKVKK